LTADCLCTAVTTFIAPLLSCDKVVMCCWNPLPSKSWCCLALLSLLLMHVASCLLACCAVCHADYARSWVFQSQLTSYPLQLACLMCSPSCNNTLVSDHQQTIMAITHSGCCWPVPVTVQPSLINYCGHAKEPRSKGAYIHTLQIITSHHHACTTLPAFMLAASCSACLTFLYMPSIPVCALQICS